jgi:hypothetical protein
MKPYTAGTIKNHNGLTNPRRRKMEILLVGLGTSGLRSSDPQVLEVFRTENKTRMTLKYPMLYAAFSLLIWP